jgi:hypothetical protein
LVAMNTHPVMRPIITPSKPIVVGATGAVGSEFLHRHRE